MNMHNRQSARKLKTLSLLMVSSALLARPVAVGVATLAVAHRLRRPAR